MQTKHVLPVLTVVASTVVFSACKTTVTNTVQPTASPAATPPAASPSESPAASTSPTTDADVKEVTVTTSYKNPSGEDTVKFTVMVDEDGVITDAVTEALAKSPISKMRQESFGKELPAVVKGKKLSELTKLDRVGGSSLTTGAFNAALEKLKAQL